MQCNLFAITKVNFFLKLAMQALSARITTELPAFPIHYSNGDVPEGKEQRACKRVIKPAFMFVPFSSWLNRIQLLPLVTPIRTVSKWISVIREEFKLQIDFSSHWLLTLHEFSERVLHCQLDTDILKWTIHAYSNICHIILDLYNKGIHLKPEKSSSLPACTSKITHSVLDSWEHSNWHVYDIPCSFICFGSSRNITHMLINT